ncbi:MAG: hypothetical protein V1766_00795 [Pseudomonadota bacterium]
MKKWPPTRQGATPCFLFRNVFPSGALSQDMIHYADAATKKDEAQRSF